MFTALEIIELSFGGFLWWLGIYSVSRNARSKIAWLIFLLLSCLSVSAVINLLFGHLNNPTTNAIVNRSTDWSYLLPLSLIFHISVIVTGREKNKTNKILIYLFYLLTSLYILASVFTNQVVNYSKVIGHIPGLGFVYPRGPLFIWLAYISIIIMVASLSNYLVAIKHDVSLTGKRKFKLPAITSIAFAITTPYLVYLYFYGDIIFGIKLTSAILVLPAIPALISIIWFRLISDVDSIFNLKEFTYLSVVIFVISTIVVGLFSHIVPQLGEVGYIWIAVFLYLTIFTHGFYDWFTTWVRDLLYNAGRGFSLITDVEVNDLVKNFHTPEKIEATTIVRFKYVKHHAENGQFVDAVQAMIREAIDYLKQPDFPRRTKQNLKYQILKMTTLDEAEEGQILWELGFDGYPVKIMSGEDSTRKPLFKVESMSDYTAVSRNAFISLKKEAIHDLAWRLSYLEKTTK